MTKLQFYWISAVIFLFHLNVVLCMSNITAVYSAGKHLSMKDNMIISAISLFIWIMGSVIVGILRLDRVKKGTQSKLLVILEIIVFFLFLYPLALIASLAFNDYSYDLPGVIGQVKKSFWQMLQVTIAYIFTRFNVIKAFIKALY